MGAALSHVRSRSPCPRLSGEVGGRGCLSHEGIEGKIRFRASSKGSLLIERTCCS